MINAGCWGTGKIAEKSMKHLLDLNLSIECFCDRDVLKQGGHFHGYPVIRPVELKERIEHLDLLVITTVFWESVFAECMELQIECEKIRYWDYKNKTLRTIDEMYAVNTYSQDGEELYLREKFSDKEKGFYVDVGSYHPFCFSNTFWAYSKGWSGINIEPNIINFKLFEQLRPRDININCGVSNTEGVMEYYQFDQAALNTFAYNYIECKNQIKSVANVKVRRLDSILKENKIRKVDFLDIDVEGLEMNVLESIDFNNVDIECILLEQLDKTSLSHVSNSCEYHFLKERGYEAVNKYGRTTLYERL